MARTVWYSPTTWVERITRLGPTNLNKAETGISNAHSRIDALSFNVKDYGALGDGATDDSVAIQAAIDACSAAGGGPVFVPPATYKCNVTLKNGVSLTGLPVMHLPGTTTGVKFIAAAAGAIIDTPVASTHAVGIEGIYLSGLGAATAGKGIHFRNVGRGIISHVTCDNFADEGVLVDSSSLDCVLRDVFAQNCVLNRSRAAVIGAVDIDGTDHFVTRIEATVSGSREGTVQSVNLYCAGIVVRGTTCSLSQMIGEISDVGVHVSGSLNRFTTCRADLNYGHGWNVVGTSNQFAACLGANNSQDTTNTYDNWFFSSASGGNVSSGCFSASDIAKVARYGFNDQVESATQKNMHVSPRSSGAGTAEYNAQTVASSGFSFPAGSENTLTVNSATPSVAGYERFNTVNTLATTITNFAGGLDGQRITVRCADANTTIQSNGSTIILSGADKKLRSGVVYEFVRASGVWFEIAALPLGVTANVGDAAKTLQARLSEETQVWASPLTVARAVTLSTTGAYAGATFRIVRTAASTGAFNLNVGTGPLKALTAGQWCDVTYDGSAWILAAFGSL